MDYKYINEYQHATPKNYEDFIAKLERMCEAYDTSIYNDKYEFKSVDEIFKDITIAGLRFYTGTVYPNN